MKIEAHAFWHQHSACAELITDAANVDSRNTCVLYYVH